MSDLILAAYVIATVLVVFGLKQVPGRTRASDFLICALLFFVSNAMGFDIGVVAAFGGWIGSVLFAEIEVTEEESDAFLKSYFSVDSESESTKPATIDCTELIDTEARFNKYGGDI